MAYPTMRGEEQMSSSEKQWRKALELILAVSAYAYDYLDDMPTDIWDMLGKEAEELALEADAVLEIALGNHSTDLGRLQKWLEKQQEREHSKINQGLLSDMAFYRGKELAFIETLEHIADELDDQS